MTALFSVNDLCCIHSKPLLILSYVSPPGGNHVSPIQYKSKICNPSLASLHDCIITNPLIMSKESSKPTRCCKLITYGGLDILSLGPSRTQAHVAEHVNLVTQDTKCCTFKMSLSDLPV